MNGAGKDFVLLDNRAVTSRERERSRELRRNSGVGADGVLVLERRRTAPISGCAIQCDGGKRRVRQRRALLRSFADSTAGPVEKLFENPRVIGAQLAANGPLQMSELRHAVGSTSRGGRKVRRSYVDSGVQHVVVPVAKLRGRRPLLGAYIRHPPRLRPAAPTPTSASSAATKHRH